MVENKTVATSNDVQAFFNKIEHKGRREDAQQLLELMQGATGEEPVLWHPSMIGFGHYHYMYDSGHGGDAFLTGFAPRKAHMVIYIMPGFSGYDALLSKLGKHKAGSSCLYLGRLSGINMTVLRRLVERSVKDMRKRHKV